MKGHAKVEAVGEGVLALTLYGRFPPFDELIQSRVFLDILRSCHANAGGKISQMIERAPRDGLEIVVDYQPSLESGPILLH